MTSAPAPHSAARRHDRGQATVLYAVVIVLAALALIPIVRLTNATAERGGAQTVADVVALAAAEAPDGRRRAVADDLARRNGATVHAFTETPLGTASVDIVVVVRVGDHEATATARRTTTWVPPANPPARWDPGP